MYKISKKAFIFYSKKAGKFYLRTHGLGNILFGKEQNLSGFIGLKGGKLLGSV